MVHWIFIENNICCTPLSSKMLLIKISKHVNCTVTNRELYKTISWCSSDRHFIFAILFSVNELKWCFCRVTFPSQNSCVPPAWMYHECNNNRSKNNINCIKCNIKQKLFMMILNDQLKNLELSSTMFCKIKQFIIKSDIIIHQSLCSISIFNFHV